MPCQVCTLFHLLLSLVLILTSIWGRVFISSAVQNIGKQSVQNMRGSTARRKQEGEAEPAQQLVVPLVVSLRVDG